ncbi:FAD-dependent oxidoreductase [Dichotomicrobium thermohalophilum]|uniref:Glycine oxidase n=1 Tax=Dichotomicrobium thermohalophilum TaxID=933063 RepID=A0A397P736_9HYPH|nr:FAD-dependent oxidoreductase [Dichotomicrobium thermohalophilum]RIA45376.1 glycine oxidase [Dichotomicrobium thermohalophilum]
MARIDVIGAGITGLWQAFTLAERGHHVRLLERSREPFADAASRLGGAMLAPYCEAEAAPAIVRDLGLHAMTIWQDKLDCVQQTGTLVVAQPRDRAELNRFAAQTEAHETVDSARVAELEPALEERFRTGLFYAHEAYVPPNSALAALLQGIRAAGAELHFGAERIEGYADFTIDCRGLAARDDLPGLRGVRGEMALVETSEITLHRPVRLLHPRFPLYVVPWGGDTYMIGATVLESDDRGPVTLRSGLDLLGLAYALHPAFGQARIVQLAADVRPAFSDNVPRIIFRGSRIYVNGMYRHGYLTAPALAAMTADYVEGRRPNSEIIVEDNG